MKKPLFLSSLVFLLAGLGTTPPPTPASTQAPLVVSQVPPDSTESAAPVEPAQTTIELLTAGEQPRQQLRFTPGVNTQQTTVMTMNMDMRGTIDGQVMPTMDLPPITMTVEADVTEINADGDIRVQMSYVDIDVASDKTAPQELVEVMRSQLEQLKDVEISYVITNQGTVQDVKVALPETIDPSLKQWMDQMLSSLEQLSAAPFPEEPVGVGAQWLVTSSVPGTGLPLDNVRILYELEDFQDGAVVLSMKMEQQADPETASELNLPGLPPNVDFDIKSFSMQTTGTMTANLNQIMPVSGVMSTLSNMEFAITDPNTDQETLVNMVSSIEMTIESPQ
ncbi:MULTISPECIES: hypothetical protein [unclassified Coleofasciculus]|uniref:hypothetical protein n=1 Tax=unclassified Coleofasciculus TaxID=2692782 RepID=UPI0018803A4E|nr:MULTISPECIES: hypothetical protein [unclassified Coleofasciculus]MBE9126599.1 hypothetical protein [Coleofasciculus sp. LEGE 07081]MBE9149920.1 hypothetical protein [Coleofasciculus sp. LEGE 07092]